MTGIDPFVHLHNHSHYSMLDGHATVKDIVAEVSRLNQPAVSITDHGNMHNAYELQQEAHKAGVQPIFGIEAYMAPTTTDRFGRERTFYGRRVGEEKVEGSEDVSGGGTYLHQTLLARSDEGLQNLFRINSKSWIEGYYRQPRMDLDLLSRYSSGIIATTGCPSGEIQTRLRLGQEKEALEFAASMRDIVGEENFFLELMDHNMSIDLERKMIPKLMEFGKKLNLPLLATNDAHYAIREHHVDHEHMLAMQTGAYMSAPTQDEGGKRFAFSGQGYYLKSAAEMAQLFPADQYPDALSNTLLVAQMCKGVGMEYDDSLRPNIPIPGGYTTESWLAKVAGDGLRERFSTITPILEDRLKEELEVINSKNFAAYFLVTMDFVKWAKNNGVTVGFGRGSVGGSLLAYVLHITELDPIRHNLLFERFLNPERDSPPDIDMDFDDENRDRVIEYVTNKYGQDNVASIVTFLKIGVKTGIKDSARILQRDYSLGERLSAAVPAADAGREMSWSDIYTPSSPRYGEAADFRSLVQELDAEDVIKVARGVEGRTKTTGVHAAGIIISSQSISDHIPLKAVHKDGHTLVVTQFDYPTCEALGLIKVDFLGLRNLTIVRHAIENIRKVRGIDVNIEDVIHGPMDDEETYRLLQRGDTLGIFQLDGGGLRELLRRLKPTAFGDIAAVLALYRPGPMGLESHTQYADRKNGLAPVVYPHPEFTKVLDPVLSETYGLCIYQEQVMAIAQVIAGYSLAQADNLRRAMGKKKKEILDAEFPPFEAGAKANGYSPAAIKALWDTLVPFAEYGFNKSHAVGYGLLSYLTAYLKANYPSEYMAAVVESVRRDKDKVGLYLHECKKMGLTVTVPNINLAEIEMTPISHNAITYGMAGIRGFSAERASGIIEERRKNGSYEDLADFLRRAPMKNVNKTVLESLTHAGAFDTFGYSRRTLVANLPELAAHSRKTQRQEEMGQSSLFSFLGEEESQEMGAINIVNIDEYDKMTKLGFERSILGLYLSDHPLSQVEGALEAMSDARVVEIMSDPSIPIGFAGRDAKKVRIAGVVSSLEMKRTKNGDEMAIIQVEDVTGTIECVVFARTLAQYRASFRKDALLLVLGTPRRKSEESAPSITIDDVREIEMTDDGYIPFNIRLTQSQVLPESMVALEGVLSRHSGTSPVFLHTYHEGQVESRGLDLSVSPSKLLSAEVSALFGVKAIGKW